MNARLQDSGLQRAIEEALGAYPLIRLAVVFGSLATGQGRSTSDLDLAVDAGRPLSADELASLIAQLAVKTGRPVDLVDVNAIGEPLLGQILRHGKRIMGSDAAYASLIRRHVFDQADFLPYRNRILEERRRAWIER